MDDGSSFDVVYWASPSVLDAKLFDLGPYAGRSLRGDVYVALMSSDGSLASMNVTSIAFAASASPSSLVPLSGWVVDSGLTDAPYVLSGADADYRFVVVGSDTQSIVDVQAAQTLSFAWTEQYKVHFVASGNVLAVTVPAGSVVPPPEGLTAKVTKYSD